MGGGALLQSILMVTWGPTCLKFITSPGDTEWAILISGFVRSLFSRSCWDAYYLAINKIQDPRLELEGGASSLGFNDDSKTISNIMRVLEIRILF